MDLDAIRARDAATFDAAHAGVGRPTECALDRRALLAEVDRLTLHVRNLASAMAGIRDSERARALPVIEAARDAHDAITDPEFVPVLTAHQWDMVDALRAALAEYDR